MRTKLCVWFACLSFSIAGCSSVDPTLHEEFPAQQEFSGSSSEAIAIAKKYLDEQNISYDNTTIRADLHSDAWWVIFSDKVPRPGGDFVVRVSHKGKVMGLDPGY